MVKPEEEKKKIVEEGLKKGNFDLKTWKTSGDEDEEEVNMTGDSPVLGVFYRSSDDTWKIKCNVNFSKKVRNMRDPAAQLRNKQELKEYIERHGLTKRDCLAACHLMFDPLLLNLGVKALLSLLYRQLIVKEPDLKYEEKIPSELLPDWERAIGFLLDIKDRTVKRSVLPPCFDNNSETCLIVPYKTASANRVLKPGNCEYI